MYQYLPLLSNELNLHHQKYCTYFTSTRYTMVILLSWVKCYLPFCYNWLWFVFLFFSCLQYLGQMSLYLRNQKARFLFLQWKNCSTPTTMAFGQSTWQTTNTCIYVLIYHTTSKAALIVIVIKLRYLSLIHVVWNCHCIKLYITCCYELSFLHITVLKLCSF